MSIVFTFVKFYLLIGGIIAIYETTRFESLSDEEKEEELSEECFDYYQNISRTTLFLAIVLFWPIGVFNE